MIGQVARLDVWIGRVEEQQAAELGMFDDGGTLSVGADSDGGDGMVEDAE